MCHPTTIRAIWTTLWIKKLGIYGRHHPDEFSLIRIANPRSSNPERSKSGEAAPIGAKLESLGLWPGRISAEATATVSSSSLG